MFASRTCRVGRRGVADSTGFGESGNLPLYVGRARAGTVRACSCRKIAGIRYELIDPDGVAALGARGGRASDSHGEGGERSAKGHVRGGRANIGAAARGFRILDVVHGD